MSAFGTAVRMVLRLVVAAGLAIDAYVHFPLAHRFDSSNVSVSQGQLFRIEAVAAAIGALLVLVLWHRLVEVLAFLIAAAGAAAVLIYRYVDIGAFGPFPDMYDRFWYAEKTLSMVAEVVAAVAAAVLVLTHGRSRESERV